MFPKPRKDKFTFIFNTENAAPKYFEIDRARLINYLIIIPTGFLLIFVAFFSFTFFSNETNKETNIKINRPVEKKISPSEINKTTNELSELQKKYAELQAQNQELTTKLTTNYEKNSSAFPDFSLFTTLPNQKDKTTPPLIKINEFKIAQEGNELHFHANLLNTIQDENSKISGHLFVIMKTDNALWVYPQNAFSKNKTTINYNSGEPVLFARLRLVDAKFPIPAQNAHPLFKVLLFSRSGDLLHKEVFPYEVK